MCAHHLAKQESSRLDRLPHNLDVENDASAVTVLSLWHMAVPLLQNIQWGYLTISGLIYYAMTIGVSIFFFLFIVIVIIGISSIAI